MHLDLNIYILYNPCNMSHNKYRYILSYCQLYDHESLSKNNKFISFFSHFNASKHSTYQNEILRSR